MTFFCDFYVDFGVCACVSKMFSSLNVLQNLLEWFSIFGCLFFLKILFFFKKNIFLSIKKTDKTFCLFQDIIDTLAS